MYDYCREVRGRSHDLPGDHQLLLQPDDDHRRLHGDEDGHEGGVEDHLLHGLLRRHIIDLLE